MSCNNRKHPYNIYIIAIPKVVDIAKYFFFLTKTSSLYKPVAEPIILNKNVNALQYIKNGRHLCV